ncbi:putative transporter [Vanrija pseudolonga]|uniref:Purtative transporter n=1 Tax=Vanrija pseudolonga TaxID=143232 RepID=A0AAF1BM26_9TREE|nr:purtative transporter [Vanrija pseudolonga]
MPSPTNSTTDIKEPTTDVLSVDERRPEALRGMSDADIAAIEKKIVRKADLVILPVMGILYILNYIDRQNLAAAKLQGIMEDLNMSTQEFATALSILFVGYLPFQIPSNLIISKLTRPGLYICCACAIWGVISAATAAVQSYHALLAIRAILGMVEAVFFPGAIYLLSAWYTKNELGKRIGGLYVGQQVGNAFGGLIAAGCLKMDGLHGIRGWRWLFIIEGSATVGIAILSALILPEYPYNARLLTPVEREVAVWRLEKEAGAGEGSEDVGTWQGFLQGFKDPKLYALIFCNMMSQTQGSIANFFPTIVKTLGYDSNRTLLLTAPPYVFAAFWYMGLTALSDKTKLIYPFIMGNIALACCTYIVPMATLSIAGRYTAMMFMPCTSVGPQLLLYKTINHHLPRPIAKRAAAIALMNAIGGTSNIWASYLWFAGPRYFAAFGTFIAAGVAFAITITGYLFYVRRENRLLDGTDEQVARVVRRGVTKEQVAMDWRYEGY